MKDFYLRTAQGGLFVNPFIKWYAKKPLIGLIAGGLVVGIVLAIAVPKAIPLLAIFGIAGIAIIVAWYVVLSILTNFTKNHSKS